MNTVTIVIPVGPAHMEIAQRAVSSAHEQTVPVQVIALVDAEQRGPGFVRNRALSQANTDFVVFLDADDWLEPTFVEECLKVVQAGRYVYTDWWQDDKLIQSPVKAWCGGSWHLVTALLPTTAVRGVNGFNETLPGGEDTEFYLKLTTSGLCGLRVPSPLVHYSADGERGRSFVKGPHYDEIMQGFLRRFEGKMGCCGDTPDQKVIESDIVNGVLAVTLWGGNHREIGRATRYWYPRTGNGAVMRVHPDDLEISPDLWRPIEPIKPVTPQPPALPTYQPVTEPPILNSVIDVAYAMMSESTPIKLPPSTTAKPNIDQVRRLAGLT